MPSWLCLGNDDHNRSSLVADPDMANLKADLDSYLSSSSKKEGMSLSNLANSFSLPTLKSPFSTAKQSGGDDTALLIENEEGGDHQPARGWPWNTQPADAQQNDCLPSMSKKQRIIGFMGCLSMGVVCFALASMYIPVLILYARKFALLFSLGSVFTLGSFSLLWGPMNHLRHLFSKERLPFTTIYLSTLFATLYFAMGLQSTVLTVMAATGQFIALLWFVISYIPGGQAGLRFFSRLCSSFCKTTVNRSLPV